MITLGIGKATVGQERGPLPDVPQSLSPAMRQALSEVVIWCFNPALSIHKLRSPELDPSAVLAIPPLDELGIETYVQAKRESYQRAISVIKQTRSEILRDGNIPVSDMTVLQPKGRLLIYEPLETVSDGASEALSLGFFDMEDAHPWDTWFLYSGGAILCWIPEAFVHTAQAGIDANPVDCIHWAKWSELPRDL